MKKLKLVVVITTILSFNLSAQTLQDSLGIEKACRNYVEGWVEGNTQRVAQGVSAELVKRTLGTDKDGVNYIKDMSASFLINIAKRNKNEVKAKDHEPQKEFKLNVIIYDIAGDYAIAKASNTKYNFFDYCQLIKYNGHWEIINVLWGKLPK